MWGAPDARRMLKPLCVAQVLGKIKLFAKFVGLYIVKLCDRVAKYHDIA